MLHFSVATATLQANGRRLGDALQAQALKGMREWIYQLARTGFEFARISWAG